MSPFQALPPLTEEAQAPVTRQAPQSDTRSLLAAVGTSPSDGVSPRVPLEHKTELPPRGLEEGMAPLEGPQGALALSTSVVGSVLHLGSTTELGLGAAAARSTRQAVCVG